MLGHLKLLELCQTHTKHSVNINYYFLRDKKDDGRCEFVSKGSQEFCVGSVTYDFRKAVGCKAGVRRKVETGDKNLGGIKYR